MAKSHKPDNRADSTDIDSSISQSAVVIADKMRSKISKQVNETRHTVSQHVGTVRSWFPTPEEEQAVSSHGASPDDIEYMSDTSSAVLQETPTGGRLILVMALVFFVLAFIWASLAELDEITRGVGKVIPSRQIQVIQNLEGGIVKKILVREGEEVNKGQILLKLDDTRFASSMRENRVKHQTLKARAVRLKAEADEVEFEIPPDLNALNPEVVAKEKKLYATRKQQHVKDYELLNKELNMTRPLVRDGVVSEVELLRLERQVNEIKGKFRNDARTEYNAVVAEMAVLEESITALKDRYTRTDVRSPVFGIVKQLMVNTEGGVVKPGMDLLEVVPLEDSLLIEAKIRPADIAFLTPEQHAIVKFTAYDYAIYGGLDAKVEHISADTITDEEGESYYQVRVRTDKNYIGNKDDPLPIIPGMLTSVDILTGKKSVLAYLLKPVLRAKERALTER